MKKNNESSYTIFNQMKDCLKKHGLPVFEDDFHCDYNPYRFLSKIQSDHYTINILCWFDALEKYANIRIIPGKCMTGLSMVDIMKLADDCNGYLDLYHLAPCPDCGSMELRSGLFVPGKNLPENKFGWLINTMIKEGERIRACFNEPISDISCTESPSEPLDRSSHVNLDDHVISKVLDDIEGVLSKHKLPIQNDFNEEKSFCIDVKYERFNDLLVRIGILIKDNPARVMMSMAPWETVPEDKMSVIMELICRINQSAIVDHMYIHPDTHRTIINKGVLMTGGYLNVKEFESALKTLLGNGSFYLSMVKEQISSSESPKKLLDRMYNKHFEHEHLK